MSEQIIDLRSTWAILRRRGGTLVVAGTLGALAGGAFASVSPPDYQSTSIVLFPPAPQGASSAAPAHTIDTQVQIASSEAVLGPAGKAVTPKLTAAQVRDRVAMDATTTDVLHITATGATPAQAEALSSAVANAEVAYVKASATAVGNDARKALQSRSSTLKKSLDAVNGEISKTQGRISKETPSSQAGRADAAALAALTAQQADLVLQIDQVTKEADAANPPDDSQAAAAVIQRASPASSTPLVLRIALLAAVGAAAASFLAGLVLVLRGRRESTLRSRDEIADAIGTPVVASIQSRAPRSVAGWTSLLESYAPDSVEMWTLRQLLRLVTPGTPGSLVEELDHQTEVARVVIVTLSDDRQALAVGPQFASFAASTGTTTQLVAAQQHESANALWAACSGVPPEAQPRPGLTVDSRQDVQHGDDLVVHLAVMDRQKPDLYLFGTGPAVTLLAVTSGTATAVDLARVALAADDAGHRIDRIVVVDPDPLDRSTGRLSPTERAQHVPLPSLMTGSALPGDATALETRRRFR